ncbi:unnamed protein product [Adineta ricciae]|uniref:dCMP deaminase n=1 Tax=Adineta ricciae TaxID=249248 RepID=A0A814EL60_ADIRI|nr:unnamed protein product [Adineta ricciae]
MLIIGLIGSLASGKHLIADILHKKHGFSALEYKDFKSQKQDAAKECLEKVKETWPKNIVVIGIDSLKTLTKMRDNPQFFGIVVEGPVILRFQRRKHEILDSLEKFVQLDDFLQFGVKSHDSDFEKLLARLHLEDGDLSPLNKCMDSCDLRLIINTNDQADLESKIEKLLAVESKAQQLTTTHLLCPNWDDYFSMVAWITASHGNCVRHRVGCIIADADQRIVAAGYNGTPDNIKKCDQGGCERCWDMSIDSGERLDECICIHGEESALLEAGRRQCCGATLYVTHSPCRQCSKKIAQSGIRRVVYSQEYSSGFEHVRKLFKEVNIELVKQELQTIPRLIKLI